MTLAQSAAVLECPGSFSERSISGYCVDSRTLKSGELFVALKGERVDGHDFLKDAHSKGAAAALVSKSYQGYIPDLPLLAVDDPLAALQKLAKNALLESPSQLSLSLDRLEKPRRRNLPRRFWLKSTGSLLLPAIVIHKWAFL